ncbi:hypothetical protein EKL02_00905 [Janthinobacterium sp. 17J80-10]|nr:hypothetical protein EKL02_00905 [Janthinobacterium sp. 17J80-10]
MNFGVSVGGQVAPGVYGQVNVGNARPVLVYQQPMVIMQPVRPMQPIYMNVPPGHAKKWSKHCHRYNACNRPVYFVKTAEYGGDYHGGGRHEHRGGDRYDYDRSERSRGHDDDHGHGHGKGNKHKDKHKDKHDH